MGTYKITKGFDLKLAGRPSTDLIDASTGTSLFALYPMEFSNIKPRLLVKEGDSVKRGTPLVEDKKNVDFKLRAPASGRIKEITRGERRFVSSIVIEKNGEEEVVEFKKYSKVDVLKASREEIINYLVDTGYIAHIKQRPFDKIADITQKPKSIFVNAMNSGPFLVDSEVVVSDSPEAFQAGINLLTKLTDGKVHLCIGDKEQPALSKTENAELHTFSGDHPAGNTSIHIDRIDPMDVHDIVWTVKAPDLVLIGKLLLEGTLPKTKIIALGGTGIAEEGRKHFKVRIGGSLKPLLEKYTLPLEKYDELSDDFMVYPYANTKLRYISGDVLSGKTMNIDSFVTSSASSITVLAEGNHRKMFGWMMPGFSVLSYTTTFASTILTFLFGRKEWRLDTNTNGGKRALVLTGHYNKVFPMNILVDFLVKAVLAHDTDEAIALGILETVPEDYALCDFICPSKTEVQDIIRQGLEEIEAEGL